MQVRGWQGKAHVARAAHLLTLPDSALLKTMEHSTFPLLIPQHLFPMNSPPHRECGWWYVPTQETEYRACPACKKHTPQTHFHELEENPQTTCKDCPISRRPQQTRQIEHSNKKAYDRRIEECRRDSLERSSYNLQERVLARWKGGRDYWEGRVTAISDNSRNTYTITYNDNDEEEDVHITLLLPAPPHPIPIPHTSKGLTLRTTDPRFPADGDIILTPMELRHLLVYQQHLPDQKVWATTAEAGFPLEEESEEIRNRRDDWEGKQTARFLHPAISNMAQHLNGRENLGHSLSKIQRAVTQLDSEWMNPANDPHSVKWHRKWENNPPPPRAKDPPRIKDCQEKKLRLGSTFLLDHPRTNTTEHGIIHIEVESKTWTDRCDETEVITRAGLSTSTNLTHSFTIL